MYLKLSVWGVSLGILALVTLIGVADSTGAATFNPTLVVTVANPEGGANSDVTIDFNVPEGDANFGAAVFFIPSDWSITPAEDVPLGAISGQVNASATLGLINGACNNVLPVEFIMLNSSTDPSDTVPYLDEDDNDTEDYAEDKDSSGLQDGFEKYPDFIARVLVDESDNPLTPIRRLAGIQVVAGINVLLQFLVFEPGTFIDEEIPNDEELGYPSVTLLQNIGDPDQDPIPGAITDFCSPLTSTIINFGISKDNGCTNVNADRLDTLCEVTSAVPAPEEGTDPDESGKPLITNPAEGTYTFTTIGAGQRDADDDGYENALDTCAFTPNEGDPRIGSDGDADTDGLDGACDPDDNVTNSDEDLDGYTNRQDNCPLEVNGDNEGESNQRDSDDDAIGDECDPNPDDPDTEGELVFATLTQDVPIGPGSPQTETPKPSDGGGDDGGGSGTTIIIIIAVIAGVVVVGGGAFYFMRRGGGGGATT